MARSAPTAEKPLASTVQVIAHRGASALRPEHTLAAYAKAIADGADFIEPDLVMTADGILLSRHENEIGGTTDVAEHAEFADRRTRKIIDGHAQTGWFTEDFTLAELDTLRARERLPQLRSTQYDGQFPLATLEQIIALVAAEAKTRGRQIGIIPEIKHGTYFRGIGLPMEDDLLTLLDAHEYTRAAPVEIQSFETDNLQYLRQRLIAKNCHNIRLLQLLDEPAEQPYDVRAMGGTLTYEAMMTVTGLRDIALYADAIGPNIRAIIPLTAEQELGEPSWLVHDAHRAGLEVHPYTFRPENQFLPLNLRHDSDPREINPAGSIAEIRRYLATGIDAFFTDDPAIGRKALDELER
ncbi:glycerophosphodiester phosphodiesterase [Rhodanobacter sp. AS-Z3]|uniref:glycerophosphodiester phosphodiesterase n=1 Tax=Rhodanobacter sp. AS-Z3 TaxID=3031330 RepID=UPI002479BB0C|nr:glycerophosphodiester phosphodiesterase [Rhodanobacter sp. AS-Z3]WEN15814.1 glycerophosphodiester phosphodiesterase [Rhodanobacter sp. AS-Z3]